MPEASERDIYTQLKYYEQLFDADRHQAKAGSDEHEILSLLQQQVRTDIERSAYNTIHANIFNVFTAQPKHQPQ